jgi:molybdopterin synthase sulfur carrier subunit
MQVTLVAFSHARDRLGWAERVVECSAEETPRAVLARVAPELPVDMMRVAVDEEYHGWDAPIGSAREIALIPPVSGG